MFLASQICNWFIEIKKALKINVLRAFLIVIIYVN